MKSAQTTLKAKLDQEGMDQNLQDLFIDFLNKCRDVIGVNFTSEHDIDSEISLNMHTMLHEYDKYRNRKVDDK